jgi:heat shock protein HslJ
MGESNSNGAARRGVACWGAGATHLSSVLLIVALGGCSTFEGVALDRTEWRATEIAGAQIGEKPESTLVFSDGGRINGNGACNQMFGGYELKGEELRFHSIGATKMACAPKVMQQESQFFTALEATRRVRPDEDGIALVLEDENGDTVAKLMRAESLRMTDDYWHPIRVPILQ